MRKLVLTLCLLHAALAAAATSVTISGVMGDKALISVDGGPPRVLGPGDSTGGVRLLAVRPNGVEVMVGERRHVLAIGQGVHTSSPSSRPRATLTADARGHFLADGMVNGLPVRFMVDTGASLVAIPYSVAQRAGVSLAGATPVIINTANGAGRAHKVILNSLRVGDIQVSLIEALVVEDGRLPIPLLGMSFLNRTNMQREGDTLALVLRY